MLHLPAIKPIHRVFTFGLPHFWVFFAFERVVLDEKNKLTEQYQNARSIHQFIKYITGRRRVSERKLSNKHALPEYNVRARLCVCAHHTEKN